MFDDGTMRCRRHHHKLKLRPAAVADTIRCHLPFRT